MLDMDVRSSPNNQLDFSLSIDILETTLANANTSTRIKFRRIGINSFDVPAQGIQLGGRLGYAYTSQDQVSATQGLDLNGYYLGLGMRWPMVEQAYLKMNFIADYLYQSVNGSSGEQSASRYWHEYRAGITLSTHIQPVLITTGLYYEKIDATQEATGTIQETRFLDNDTKTQATLSLHYLLLDNEQVGLQLSAGSAKGISFIFQKLFW